MEIIPNVIYYSLYQKINPELRLNKQLVQGLSLIFVFLFDGLMGKIFRYLMLNG
jgi:hypothetical protein